MFADAYPLLVVSQASLDHLNDKLDQQRRQIVVNALAAMGITNADELVIVAPAFSEGLNSEEAAAAYEAMQFGSSGSSGLGAGSTFGGIQAF